MQSAFSGIELGKRGLFAHQVALHTTGHNLTNASREGYSRQRVELSASPALDRPGAARADRPGQIGQGVDVARVSRVRDRLLERRIVGGASTEAYWAERDKYLLMTEQVYNEPSDLSVRNLMDRFWDSWQELSIHPDQMASRQAVLQRGEALIEGVRLRYQGLDDIRAMLEDEIRGAVVQVNELTREIAELNTEIERIQAAGDNPNDLLDRRDELVGRLAEYIDVTIDDRDPNEFHVHTAGRIIIQGGLARQFSLEANPNNDGLSNVRWSDSGEEARFRDGRLAAFVEMRDDDLRREVQNLDNMAVNFMDLVNEIHQEGFGINQRTGQDFFVTHPYVANVRGNYDSDGNGVFDQTRLFRIGGTNRLDATEQIGLQGEMTLNSARGNVVVPYYPTDTVGDVVARINNSGSEVVARLNRHGEMELKAAPADVEENPDFVIRYVSDNGRFLTDYAGILSESGPAGAFTWTEADAALGLRGDGGSYAVAPLAHPSGWIDVNPDIVREPASIAASFSDVNGTIGEPGNGQAALEIAALRNQPVMVGQIATFDDYFADSIADIGLRGQEAQLAFDTQEMILKDLKDLRQSLSGVNIDEELSEMVKFQHGYNAAARFVSVVDEMLDTVINRLGL